MTAHILKLRTESDRHLGGEFQRLRAHHLHAADLRADVALAHGQAEVAPFVVERGLEREVPFTVQSESALHLLLYACCFPTCRCTLVVPIREHHETRRAVDRDLHRRRAVAVVPEVRERLLRAVPRVPQLGRARGAERAVARLLQVADEIHVVAAHVAVERLGRAGRAEVGRTDAVGNRLQLLGGWLGGECDGQLRDERVDLRLLRVRGVRELRLRAEDGHLATRALERNELFKRRPLDRDHVRHDNHPVRLAGNAQASILRLGSGERVGVDEIDVRLCLGHETLHDVVGDAHGDVPPVPVVHARLERVHHRHVAHVDALAEHVAQTLEVLEERLHVRPVRHAEVVARRHPLPPAAVGGIVEAMEVQKV